MSLLSDDLVQFRDSAVPYSSLAALKEAHMQLLRRHRQDGETDEVLAVVEAFIRQGAATGVLLDADDERDATQSLLDYWVTVLYRVKRMPPDATLAEFDASLAPTLDDAVCPYLGLSAFQERNQDVFFGRRRLVESMVAQLEKERFLAVLGPSGSGKSSVVLAGLIPLLEQGALRGSEGWTYLSHMVPGPDPLQSLALLMKPADKGSDEWVRQQVSGFRGDSQHLAKLVEALAPGPAVIVVDQFEEVFTLCTEDEARRAFVDNLLALVRTPSRRHLVVVTMRTDFETRVALLPDLHALFQSTEVRVTPLSALELREVIVEPASRVGLKFEDGIIDELVRDILGEPAGLPLLQFTLLQLWKSREKNRVTWRAYRALGGAREALKRAADEFYEGLIYQDQQTAKRILLRLVRPSEGLEVTSNRVRREILHAAGEAFDQVDRVLEKLVAAGLVRLTQGEMPADDQVEVAHEALIRNWPRLVGWLEDERATLRQRLRLTVAAEQWLTHGKDPGGLLGGSLLEEALHHTDLTELETQFVEASRQAVEQAQRDKELAYERELQAERRRAEEQAAATRRLRGLMSVVAVVSLIAIVAIFIATYQSVRATRESVRATRESEKAARESEKAARESEKAARENERTAREAMQTLALQPLHYVDDRLDLALLLNIEANRMGMANPMADRPELRRSLLSALTTNLELQSFLRGHTAGVRAVAFSPNGKILASGSYDTTIILWDVATGRMLYPPLQGHRGHIYGLAFSPDGKTLASASLDKSVRVWDVATGESIDTLPHGDAVYSVSIRNDGRLLASGGKDGAVQLWNLESRTREGTLSHSTDAPVYNVAFSPDGVLLASGGKDGRIVLWDMETRSQAGEPLMVYREVFSMAFSHDGKTIASGNQEGRIDLWDVSERQWKASPGPSHLRGVYGLAFSPDNKQLLATVSQDRTVYIRNVQDANAPAQLLKGYGEQFDSVGFTANGKVATGTKDGMVILWDLRQPYRIGEILQPPTEKLTRLAYSRDGRLVSFSEDKLVFWEGVETGKPISLGVEAAQSGINLVALAPDGEALVTVGLDNSIKLWDMAERRPIKTLVQPGKEKILSVAFSADSRDLALGVTSTQGYSEIRLLSLSDGIPKKLSVLPGQDQVMALAFSPNGKLLAFAGLDFGIAIWDLATRKATTNRLEHVNVFSLAFSPDSRMLASGGKDSTIRLWDAAEGRSVGEPLAYHRGPVWSVAFSPPDGKWLASASSDRTVLLWDVATRQRISPPLVSHADLIYSVAFSPNGQRLATSANDGSINLWDLRMATWESRACQVVGRNLTPSEWQYFFGDKEPRITCPHAKIKDADELALAGDRAGAERLFDEALGLVLQTEDPAVHNELCWLGSIHAFATKVRPACERAVALAPEPLKDWYRDSLGLALALVGETVEAIENFEAGMKFITALRNFDGKDVFLKRREDWIAALRESRHLFTSELLKLLRIESIEASE